MGRLESGLVTEGILWRQTQPVFDAAEILEILEILGLATKACSTVFK